MPFDAPFLAAVCGELRENIIGSRIDRINMPERDMLILSLHTLKGNTKLLISFRTGCTRIHLTQRCFENPSQPPMFCMLLRKHLSGGRILAVEQPNLERLVLLRIEAVDELGVRAPWTLAVELMGKGVNLTLLDADNRILDCLRRVDFESSRRAMLPGLFYELPPLQDKPSFFELSPELLEEQISTADKGEEPERWLMRSFRGLSPFLCRELSCGGWGLLSSNAAKIQNRIICEDYEPIAFYRNGEGLDFSFLPAKQYGDAAEQKAYTSFSELLDSYFSDCDRRENLRRKGSELHRTVKSNLDRLQRKLSARKTELTATENREQNRRYADLITANIYRLKKGLSSFETEDFYEDNMPLVTVPLDPLKNPQQNAARYYKLYTKAVKAEKMLTALIKENEEAIAYLESVQDELNRAQSLPDLADIRRELISCGYIRDRNQGKKQKLPAPRKPMRFISDTGTEILVGRGNEQNDLLTFKLARRTDLWLHVQKVPGSHVIISQAERKADETTLQQAATLAVTYSKACSGGKTAVDFTEVRFVKKPSGALPGRVNYTDYSTIISSSDEALAARLKAEI